MILWRVERIRKVERRPKMVWFTRKVVKWIQESLRKGWGQRLPHEEKWERARRVRSEAVSWVLKVTKDINKTGEMSRQHQQKHERNPKSYPASARKGKELTNWAKIGLSQAQNSPWWAKAEANSRVHKPIRKQRVLSKLGSGSSNLRF